MAGGSRGGLSSRTALLTALAVIVAANALSYAVGAALVGFGVRAPRRERGPAATGSGYRTVLADRHFRRVLAAYVALPLAVNAGTVALPVYLVQRLALPAWLPGAVGLTIAVAVTVFRRYAVGLVRDRNRARTLRTAATCCLVYFLGIAGLVFAPAPLRIPILVCSLVPYIGSNLVQNAVATALVEAMAPVDARGRYLAVSQYCWAGTGVLAPVMVSLYSVSNALPWLLSAGVAAGSIVLFGGLAVRLPAGVVYRPDAVFEG